MRTYNRYGYLNVASPDLVSAIGTIKSTLDAWKYQAISNNYSYVYDDTDGVYYKMTVKTVDGYKQLDIDESVTYATVPTDNVVQLGSDGYSYILDSATSKYYRVTVKTIDGFKQLDIDESHPYNSVP